MILVFPTCHWQHIRTLLRAGQCISNRRTKRGINYLVIR